MATSDSEAASRAEIEADFPRIAGRYRITSRKRLNHNCVAYALGDLKKIWDPDAEGIPGYYWPPGIPRDGSIASCVRVFELHGYEICDNALLENGSEKIAIYADDDGQWQHVALQLSSGKWTSKLSVRGHDVEHDTPDVLVNGVNTHVSQVMRRRRQGAPLALQSWNDLASPD